MTCLDFIRSGHQVVCVSTIVSKYALSNVTTILLPANLISQFEVSSPLVIDNCSTVEEALKQVVNRYPGINEYLYSDSGSLRRFLNLYVDGEDIRFLNDTNTSLDGITELSILMAVAGG